MAISAKLSDEQIQHFFDVSTVLADTANEIEMGAKLHPSSAYWRPIDDFLEILARRRRAPKLVSHHELSTLLRLEGCSSINAWIRYQLYRSFERLAFANEASVKLARDQAKAFCCDADSLRKAIDIFLHEQASASGLPAFANGLPPPTQIERRRLASLLEKRLEEARSEFDLMSSWALESLENSSKDSDGRPRLEWKEIFAASMARTWSLLTGCRPSASQRGLFVEFVEAGWGSGCDNLPNLSWERPVRSVCENLR
jgi:hypothetical protein